MIRDHHTIQDVRDIMIISMAKGWGGAEEYLENLRVHLSRKGIDYRIIVREGGAYANRYPEEDKIIPVPHTIRELLRFKNRGFHWNAHWVIHVNRYYDIFWGWYLKRTLPGTVLILYQHCFLNHPHRIPLSLTDGIICISEFVKSSIADKFPIFREKIIVINPGIDLDLFQQSKKDYGIHPPIKIGMVGRFDKNQEDLIEIAHQLKKKSIPVTIHLVGSGKPEEEKKLRGIVNQLGLTEQIIFRGNIPHPLISQFYLEMDMCVSTMKREGLSLFAMEAMACGVPFVSYNAPGFNEVINHEENGILVEGDVAEFVHALQSLISSQEKRKALGENAFKKARRSFGMEDNVKKYLDSIRELIVKKESKQISI